MISALSVGSATYLVDSLVSFSSLVAWFVPTCHIVEFRPVALSVIRLNLMVVEAGMKPEGECCNYPVDGGIFESEEECSRPSEGSVYRRKKVQNVVKGI